MNILKPLLWGLSLVLMPLGAFWAAQGFGLLDWPAGSFMHGAGEWARNGLLALVAGLGLFWWGRRG